MSVEVGRQNDSGEFEMSEMGASDQTFAASQQEYGEDVQQLAQPTAPPQSPPQTRFCLTELHQTVDHQQVSPPCHPTDDARSTPDQQIAGSPENGPVQYQQLYEYPQTLGNYPSEDFRLENQSLQRYPPYQSPYSPDYSNLPARPPPFPPFSQFPPAIAPDYAAWWTQYSAHLPPIPPPVLPPNGDIYWHHPAPQYPLYPHYPFYPHYYHGGIGSPVPPWFTSPVPFRDPARDGYPPNDWMLRPPAPLSHHPEIHGESEQMPAVNPDGRQPHLAGSVSIPSAPTQGRQLEPGERFWESLPPPPLELLSDDAGQAEVVAADLPDDGAQNGGSTDGAEARKVVSPSDVVGVVVKQPPKSTKNQYRCHIAVAAVALLFPLFGVPALLLAVKARRDARSTSPSKRESSSQLARSSIGYTIGSFVILACVTIGLAVGYGVASIPGSTRISSSSTRSASSSSSSCPASSTYYYLNSYCYLYRLAATSSKQCVFGFYSAYFCYYDNYYYGGSDRDTCNGLGADRGSADGNCYYTSQGACRYSNNYIGGVCYTYALAMTSATSCKYGVYQQATGQCYYTTKSSTDNCSYGDKAQSGLCYYTV